MGQDLSLGQSFDVQNWIKISTGQTVLLLRNVNFSVLLLAFMGEWVGAGGCRVWLGTEFTVLLNNTSLIRHLKGFRAIIKAKIGFLSKVQKLSAQSYKTFSNLRRKGLQLWDITTQVSYFRVRKMIRRFRVREYKSVKGLLMVFEKGKKERMNENVLERETGRWLGVYKVTVGNIVYLRAWEKEGMWDDCVLLRERESQR